MFYREKWSIEGEFRSPTMRGKKERQRGWSSGGTRYRCRFSRGKPEIAGGPYRDRHNGVGFGDRV